MALFWNSSNGINLLLYYRFKIKNTDSGNRL